MDDKIRTTEIILGLRMNILPANIIEAVLLPMAILVVSEDTISTDQSIENAKKNLLTTNMKRNLVMSRKKIRTTNC